MINDHPLIIHRTEAYSGHERRVLCSLRESRRYGVSSSIVLNVHIYGRLACFDRSRFDEIRVCTSSKRWFEFSTHRHCFWWLASGEWNRAKHRQHGRRRTRRILDYRKESKSSYELGQISRAGYTYKEGIQQDRALQGDAQWNAPLLSDRSPWPPS